MTLTEARQHVVDAVVAAYGHQHVGITVTDLQDFVYVQLQLAPGDGHVLRTTHLVPRPTSVEEVTEVALTAARLLISEADRG